MGRPSDASTVALLLAQRISEVPEPPLKAREFWAVMDSIEDPATLLGQSASDIARLTSLDPALSDRIAARLHAATAFAIEREQLERSGIAVVSPLDDGYPQRLVAHLGQGAPPMLYVAGDPEILKRPALAIVGSRDVSREGAEVARDAAQLAVRNGYAVVSGGAKGVDQLAMRAALDAGGAVVGVLADSLSRQLREPETRQAVIDGAVCLCTPYKPSAGFTPANAMGRNKLIYALADATLVVASDHDKGGTWAGAVEALRARYTDVVIWMGDGCGSGNPALSTRGGRPVTDVESIFPFQRPPAEDEAALTADQLALDV